MLLAFGRGRTIGVIIVGGLDLFRRILRRELNASDVVPELLQVVILGIDFWAKADIEFRINVPIRIVTPCQTRRRP